jgi:Dolichyl-phosphate-mannose-protein mannosyltransferase
MTTVAALRPAPALQPAAVHDSRNRPRLLQWLPLTVILMVQTVLSVRLIPQSIASGDESLYIYSGHQLIHELWHGGGSPYYETFFSGAPDLYPVIAATIDHVGGLAAVRLASMVFMLVSTTLLFATARIIFGYWPAVAAAGLFAGLGITQALGALATYDALALMLTAAAAYCAVKAATDDAHSTHWLALVPLALLTANAVKYASGLFDPVVLGLAALLISHEGWKRAAQRFTVLSLATVLLIILAVYLGGTAYYNGIAFTTLDRKTGTQVVISDHYTPTHEIILSSWDWAGAILCLGVLALLTSMLLSYEKRNTILLAVMLSASVLVVAEYVHLHALTAFSKHADFGVWFTCMGGGYALGRAAELAPRWYVKLPVIAVALTAAIFVSIYYSNSGIGGPVQDSRLYVVIKPYLELKNGRYLLGGALDTQMIYTDHINVTWYQYVDDNYIKYPVPGRGGDSHGQATGLVCTRLEPGCMYLEDIAGYRAAIRAHWFTVISMVGAHGTLQDAQIEQAVERTPGYVLLSTVGGAPTWIYAPAYAHQATLGLDSPRK